MHTKVVFSANMLPITKRLRLHFSFQQFSEKKTMKILESIAVMILYYGAYYGLELYKHEIIINIFLPQESHHHRHRHHVQELGTEQRAIGGRDHFLVDLHVSLIPPPPTLRENRRKPCPNCHFQGPALVLPRLPFVP